MATIASKVPSPKSLHHARARADMDVLDKGVPEHADDGKVWLTF